MIIKLFIMAFFIALAFGLWQHFNNPNYYLLLPAALLVIVGFVQLAYKESRK